MAAPKSGFVYLHRDFYRDTDGQCQRKYLLVLAIGPGGDAVVRLLTSRRYGRPEDPLCCHGDPYPSFFLGTANGLMEKPTWLDLRGLDDYDDLSFKQRLNSELIVQHGRLPDSIFCVALDCAAAADDTSHAQETAMRDLHATLDCG